MKSQVFYFIQLFLILSSGVHASGHRVNFSAVEQGPAHEFDVLCEQQKAKKQVLYHAVLRRSWERLETEVNLGELKDIHTQLHQVTRICDEHKITFHKDDKEIDVELYEVSKLFVRQQLTCCFLCSIKDNAQPSDSCILCCNCLVVQNPTEKELVARRDLLKKVLEDRLHKFYTTYPDFKYKPTPSGAMER